MNLSHLEAFVAVCSAGSFTRAADRMAVTKSAVSQSVAHLERELGVQLLHRSTRSLTLTDTGTTLLTEARALLDQARRVAEKTRDHAARLSGLLRVSSSEITVPLMAPVIAEYARLHPDMQVEFLPSDSLIDLAAEGIDLSVRATGKRDSSLRAAPLAIFDVWCVAAPSYLQQRGTPDQLAALASHAWIAFTPIPTPWTLHTRDGKHSVRLQRSLSASTTAGGRALALAGAGIFAAPSFALESEIASGQLVRVLPRLKLPQVALYAAWPGKHEPPVKTRAFIELAKSRLRS